MLVPRSDMFYQAQQYSTLFYINTVPIWKNINDQNWNLVEQIVRKVASKQSNELDVWTGGIDNLSLNNAEGKKLHFSYIIALIQYQDL
jgi:DNA/RNA endonuclease G (NUC1)